LSTPGAEVAVFHDLPSALKWLGREALPDCIKPEGAKKGNSAQAPKGERIA